MTHGQHLRRPENVAEIVRWLREQCDVAVNSYDIRAQNFAYAADTIESLTKNVGGLTYEQLLVACTNIGFNLDCGECASVFFTGYGGYTHDPECVRGGLTKCYASTFSPKK